MAYEPPQPDVIVRIRDLVNNSTSRSFGSHVRLKKIIGITET
jgi:hypothetical protein